MMKKLCVVMLLFSLTTLTPVIVAAGPPPVGPVQAGKRANEGGERHPHIRAAIKELQEAKRELETAAHDFGGHRVEAIEAIDNAIKQLHQALEYDKK